MITRIIIFLYCNNIIIPHQHQIRANNEYVSSNWSDPYPIILVSDGSRSCNQEESMDTEWISNVSFTTSDVTFAEYGEEVPINGK